MQEKNPTVFISYSHDSEEHQDRVLKFSNKLRDEGIDCILDQYEDSPPEGWPKWMALNVKNSDFVLVICTEIYYNRVMGIADKGKGIKWESTLIYQELYNAGANNTRFIPLIFNDSKFENIPEPLQSATYYNIDNKNEYDKLYWRLRGVKTKKPELGKLRKLPKKERKTLFISELINQEDWERANWKNGVGYMYPNDDKSHPIMVLFFETLKQGQELFDSIINKIGNTDESERLRIVVVEGEVPGQENGYFVIIDENIEVTEKIVLTKVDSNSIDGIAVNKRIHRVYTSESSPYLDLFKKAYNKNKFYYLAPGIQINEKGEYKGFKIDFDHMILKRKIEFRNYDEIPEYNDPDSILKTDYIKGHKF